MVATRSQRHKAAGGDFGFPALPTPERKKKSTNQHTRCALFDLPAELRNSIYGYILDDAIPADIDLGSLTQPAVACTCKQLRSEVMPMVLPLLLSKRSTLPLRVCVERAVAERLGLSYSQSYANLSVLPWLRAVGDQLINDPDQISFVVEFVNLGLKLPRGNWPPGPPLLVVGQLSPVLQTKSEDCTLRRIARPLGSAAKWLHKALVSRGGVFLQAIGDEDGAERLKRAGKWAGLDPEGPRLANTRLTIINLLALAKRWHFERMGPGQY